MCARFFLELVRGNLTRVTSPPNSNTDGSRLTFSVSFSYISFSYFTFPSAPYRILLLFLPWLPCHFYLAVIEQQVLQPLMGGSLVCLCNWHGNEQFGKIQKSTPPFVIKIPIFGFFAFLIQANYPLLGWD